MTIINQKSISGITSITFASAGDDLLTFHSNNGTERFRIDNSGNTKITAGIVTTLTVTGTTTLNGNLDLQDDDKILAGTGDDLQIYHDGSKSLITDSGTGWLEINTNNLRVQNAAANETIIYATENGSVDLYYDNSKKFETTTNGVTITGTATATEGLVLDGQTGSGKGLRLDLAGSGDYIIQETTTDDVVQFGGTGASNFFVHNISSGRIGINTTTPNGDLHIGHLPTGSGNVNVVTLDRDDGTLIYGIDYNGSQNLVSFTGDNKQFAFANKSGSAEAVRILNTGGLTFNGDTAAANALDDYEEGTWTPTVSSAGSVTGEDAKYTKIGNLVHVYGKLTSFTNRSSSNTIVVTSLPYTASTNQAGGSMFARYCDRTAYTVYVYSNNIEFYSIGSGNFTSLQHSHLNNDNSVIYFQATYNVA